MNIVRQAAGLYWQINRVSSLAADFSQIRGNEIGQESKSLQAAWTDHGIPLFFVVLWSTGYIGAKYGLPYAEPFTFLAIRMAITLAILVPVVLIFVRVRPTPVALGHSLFTGVLIHACYLGGVFFAISRGMSSGVSAMIVALQPLLTAVVARLMLSERISTRQVLGIDGGDVWRWPDHLAAIYRWGGQ